MGLITISNGGEVKVVDEEIKNTMETALDILDEDEDEIPSEDIEAIRVQLKHTLDDEQIEEIIGNIERANEDFYIADGDYRIIKDTIIDDILKDELVNDYEPILGWFNASFLANYINVSEEVIKKTQKAEAWDIIHELAKHHIDDIIPAYVESDGYGNHFSHYDGRTSEFKYNDVWYYLFRLN